ncbi:MAG: L-proline glycine betaine transport system permease protein ProV [Labilithrix sp.]|nr:L-proline glycine betaine transport system permease protein ProV [Labilithrix sp.]
MAALALERVTKAFGTRAVIRETSLELAAGEKLALIGPSGCGKSTLLRMILGLVVPDSGTVRVGDVVVSASSARAVRRRVGYVIQDGGLFPHLTAEENVTLVSRLNGRDGAALRARVSELAELAGLPEALLSRFPHALSGGERQRVGLMRALMLDPDVLLLDEPLGALDPIVRARLQEDLRDAFRKLEKSVLLVTHDMAEAAYLADSIAVMRDGAIVQRGTMKDLVDAPAHPFVAEFVGAQRTLTEALR